MKLQELYEGSNPLAAAWSKVATAVKRLFKKEHSLINPLEKKFMMDEFEKRRVNEQLDLASWCLGWQVCFIDPTLDPSREFEKLHFGDPGSSIPFERSSFMKGFRACRESKNISDHGSKNAPSRGDLLLRDFRGKK